MTGQDRNESTIGDVRRPVDGRGGTHQCREGLVVSIVSDFGTMYPSQMFQSLLKKEDKFGSRGPSYSPTLAL